MKPIFSIITPTYNRIKQLKKLYRHLLSQKKKELIERVIVVEKNDLETIKFLKKIKLKKKIVINNGGLQNSFKNGSLKANGQYISFLGDDDFLTKNKYNTSERLINAFMATGKSQLSAMEVDKSEVSKYGIISPSLNSNAVLSMVEKPKINEAPSNLASIGRYILTPDIFSILRELKPGFGNEIQLTDAINVQARNNAVEFVHLASKRFDCGSLQGYLQAISYTAKEMGYNF